MQRAARRLGCVLSPGRLLTGRHPRGSSVPPTYTGGDAPAGACAFPFTRGSTGYGAGFPVTATATWGASWTSSETPGAQPLPTVTTDSTVDVPVAESQALVREVG